MICSLSSCLRYYHSLSSCFSLRNVYLFLSSPSFTPYVFSLLHFAFPLSFFLIFPFHLFISPSRAFIFCLILPLSQSVSPCICFLISPFIALFVHLFFYLSLYLLIFLFIALSTYLSIYLSLYLLIFLSIALSTYHSIYLSLYLPIPPSIYRSICLALHLSPSSSPSFSKSVSPPSSRHFLHFGIYLSSSQFFTLRLLRVR